MSSSSSKRASARLCSAARRRKFTSVRLERSPKGLGLFVCAWELAPQGTVLAVFGEMKLYEDRKEARWPPQFSDCMVQVPSDVRAQLELHGNWVAAPSAESMEELQSAGLLGAFANCALSAEECNARFRTRVVRGALFIDVVASRDIVASESCVEVLSDYGPGFRKRIVAQIGRATAAAARSSRSPAARPKPSMRGQTVRTCGTCHSSYRPREMHLHCRDRCASAGVAQVSGEQVVAPPTSSLMSE
jgi:hypothetical protein